jgi:transposase
MKVIDELEASELTNAEFAMHQNTNLDRILVDKFADHMPVNRQAKRMGREGFDIGTNTMSGWVRRRFAFGRWRQRIQQSRRGR